MADHDWVKNFPAEITVCDSTGSLCEMNLASEVMFESDGGIGLLQTNVLDCHPDPCRGKLERLMDDQKTNAYLSTKNGKTRFIFQAPWKKDGTYSGYVEISFEVPQEIQHFVRG